jgi:hypothetical protein
MMKLSLYPNNYFAWPREFIIFSSWVNASLAFNLDRVEDLGFDHYLDGIPQDYILGMLSQDSSSDGTASAQSGGMVKLIMAHPQGNFIVDELKFMVFETMLQERAEKEKIILALLDSLSLDSMEVVETHPDFQGLQEAADLKTLWKLIKETHDVRMKMVG